MIIETYTQQMPFGYRCVFRQFRGFIYEMVVLHIVLRKISDSKSALKMKHFCAGTMRAYIRFDMFVSIHPFRLSLAHSLTTQIIFLILNSTDRHYFVFIRTWPLANTPMYHVATINSCSILVSYNQIYGSTTFKIHIQFMKKADITETM